MLGNPVRLSVAAVSSASTKRRAFSMVRPTLELTAINTREWSLVKAPPSRWYSVSAPMAPWTPGSGTDSADRWTLNLPGSFRYPGSTDGLPLMIDLLFCTTHPEMPSPSGMTSDENRAASSPDANRAARQQPWAA